LPGPLPDSLPIIQGRRALKLTCDKVAGLVIHRDTVVTCCRVHHQGRRVAWAKGTFATATKGLKELVDWLSEASVSTIAMEATGVYWLC